MSDTITLDLQAVGKDYDGVSAVRALSVQVRRGEFVTLLGPSGCGKTTTLRMIAGFIKPDRGTIRLNGRILSDAASGAFLPPEARGMGMVFQSYAVWPHMTVFHNVAYPLRVARRPRAEIAQRVAEALKLVALTGYEKRYPHQLSGGQQQRVALARALIANPAVLLLDEPLSNLDARLRDSTRYEIVELQKRLGITVIYVTHDQAEAMAMSDRIVVMERGEALQIDTPRAIYTAPAHRFVAAFIGAANFLPCQIVERRPDGLSVRLDAGGALVPTRSSAPIEGERALLMVRPEHVMLADEGQLSGEVARSTYLGERVELDVRVHGQALRVLLPDHADLPPVGAAVRLKIGQSAALEGTA